MSFAAESLCNAKPHCWVGDQSEAFDSSIGVGPVFRSPPPIACDPLPHAFRIDHQFTQFSGSDVQSHLPSPVACLSFALRWWRWRRLASCTRIASSARSVRARWWGPPTKPRLGAPSARPASSRSSGTPARQVAWVCARAVATTRVGVFALRPLGVWVGLGFEDCSARSEPRRCASSSTGSMQRAVCKDSNQDSYARTDKPAR